MKNLNTYIQEGLFDNIGIGIEQQIERWFNDNFPNPLRLEDINEFKNPSIRYSGLLIYFINPDDCTIDISLHSGISDVFNYKFEKIHVPKYIQINNIYINSNTLRLNDLEVEDWKSFLPKKIINIRKIEELRIEDCNIDNKNLQNFINQFFKVPRFHVLEVSSCPSITECDVKINSNESISANFAGCNIKKITGNLESLKNSIYLNLSWNKNTLPDLSKLKLFTGTYFMLSIPGSKLEQEIKNKYNSNPKDPDIYSICNIFDDIKKNINKDCSNLLITGKFKNTFTKDKFCFSTF